MKKILIFCLSLLILASTAFAYLSIDTLKDKENVEFTEVTVKGDIKNLPKTEIRIEPTFQSQLFWTTDMVFDGGFSYETDYEFFIEAQREVREYEPSIYIYCDVSNSLWEKSDGGETDFMGYIWDEMEAEARELGVYKLQKSIKVADYFDYYPIYSEPNELQLNEDYTYEDWTEFLTDNFKIPINPNETIDLEIEISEDPNRAGFSGSSTNNSGSKIFGDGVYFDEKYYFFVAGVDENEEMVDVSGFKNGNGIYSLDVSDKRAEIASKTLTNVFPIGNDEYIRNLILNEEQEELFLYCEKGLRTYLYIIDLNTLELKEKIDLLELEKDNKYCYLYVFDDFFVSRDNKDIFTLYEKTDSGYQKALTGDFSLGGEYDNYMQMEIADYKDGKLVTANPFGYRRILGFDLLCFDETGLAYYGKINHSFDKDNKSGSDWIFSGWSDDYLSLEIK